MKIYIHRGQNQIGGSIVELTTDKTRLFFDVGINLDETTNKEVPAVDGLFCGDKNCDGVFISHYHSDHIGLLETLVEGIPIYMGEKAYKVYKAAVEYRGKETGFVATYVYDKQPILVGDITITPYLCDHSAFDSYMFLIEADNKKVLYTGDYRANGRLEFDELLEKLPSVDVVITEGTTLTRKNIKGNIEEEKLEEIAVEYLSKYNAPAFIMMSAMNIERLVTAYNVAQKTNRVLLEDIYTADIAVAAGSLAPEPNIDEGVRVFMTGGNKQYQRLQEYDKAKIGKYEIAKTPFIMCIRQSMKNYLEKLSELVSFENGVLFYGMWKGYMEQPETKAFIEFLQNKGVKLHILHTSGHADETTIDSLIKKVDPKAIIPIHTENAEWFNRYSHQCQIISSNTYKI